MKCSTLVLLGTLLFLFSCEVIENPGLVKAPAWNPAFASAIIHTEVSFQDALDMVNTGDYLEIDASGALALVYEGNLLEGQKFSIISLPDFSVPMFSPSFDFPFPISGIESISLKQGTLDVVFESNTSEDFAVDLTISALYEEGKSYQKTVEFSGTGEHRFSIPLEGMEIKPHADQMHFEYDAFTSGDKHAIGLDNFEYIVTGLDFNYIQGSFAQQVLELSTDSLRISLDSSLKELDFSLAEPEFTFTASNSFGIPLEFKVEKLQIFQNGAEAIDVQSQELREGLVLNYPSTSEIGISKTTEIRINKDNSNIEQAMSMIPDGITWGIAATIFPDSNVQAGFLLDSSSIGVDLKARLPLKGSLGEVEISQILDTEIDKVDILSAAGLRLLVENEIPLGIALQVYFLDENEVVQDSIFDGFATLLEAAPVDANGFVSGPASSTLDIDLDETKLQKLFEARYFMLKAKVSTTDKGASTVHFSSHNKLRIKMGVRGEANLSD